MLSTFRLAVFAYGAWGWEDQDGSTLGYALGFPLTGAGCLDCDFNATKTWYGKVGLREHWTHLGHTVLYGEYERVQDPYDLQVLTKVNQVASAAQPAILTSSAAIPGCGASVRCRRLTRPPCPSGSSTAIGRPMARPLDATATATTARYSGFSDMKELTFGGLINF